jgi:hypothetical protein
MANGAEAVWLARTTISVMQRLEGVIVYIIRNAPAPGDPFSLVE